MTEVWERQFLVPDSPENSTGLLLLNAELCSNARKALRIFEDYRQLVGAWTWNPARIVTPVQAENPAQEVLEEFGLEHVADLGEWLRMVSPVTL